MVGFNLFNLQICSHFFGVGSVEDMNLFDPVFSMTLLHFGEEDALLGITTVLCFLEVNVLMPAIHDRIVFSGNLLCMQNEGVFFAVKSIQKVPFEHESQFS